MWEARRIGGGNGICPEITTQGPSAMAKVVLSSILGVTSQGKVIEAQAAAAGFLHEVFLAGTLHGLLGGSSTHSVGVPGSFCPTNHTAIFTCD